MYSTRQTKKVAANYLLNGQDTLEREMHASKTYNKYYKDYLFSEKNILKNLKEASQVADSADNVIASADKLDFLLKGSGSTKSIYSQFFSGKDNKSIMITNNTINNTNNKDVKSKISESEVKLSTILDTSENFKQRNEELLQKLKKQNTMIQNGIYETDKVEMQSMLKKQSQLNKLKTYSSLPQFEKINENSSSLQQNSSSQVQQNISQLQQNSSSNFQPYGQERDSLGFIIQPMSEYTQQLSDQVRKKAANLPIEQQRISTIIPPSKDNVLIIKKGLHFFDRGISLRSTRENENIILMAFAKNLEQNMLPDNNTMSVAEINLNRNINPKEHEAKQNISQNSNLKDNIVANQTTEISEQPFNKKLLVKSSVSRPYLNKSMGGDFNNVLTATSGTPTNQNLSFLSKDRQSQSHQFLDTSNYGSPTQESYLLKQNKNPLVLHNIEQNSVKGTNLPSSISTGTSNSKTNSMQTQYFRSPNKKVIPAKRSSEPVMEEKTDRSKTDKLEKVSFTNEEKKDDTFERGEEQQQQEDKQYCSNCNHSLQNNSHLLSSDSRTLPQSKRAIIYTNNDIPTIHQMQSEYLQQQERNHQKELQYLEVNMKSIGGEASDIELGKFAIVKDSEVNISSTSHNTLKKKDQKSSGSASHFKWKMNALDEAHFIEFFRMNKESKIKLPKLSIYDKSKYISDQYPAPGDYDPIFEFVEKHSPQVIFDKAQGKFDQSSINKRNKTSPSSNYLPSVNEVKPQPPKEEGYEMMFSELMKDIKNEVRLQKLSNKELQHPQQELQLSPISHQNILDLNKRMSQKVTYCKNCLNVIKSSLKSGHPLFEKRRG